LTPQAKGFTHAALLSTLLLLPPPPLHLQLPIV